jgi:CHASE3 domain sensor protein
LKKSGLFMMTIVLFGIMLLASQIYNYLYIKELNRNYREIITTKTLELQSLEIITREASDIQHALLQIALNSKDIERWKKEVSSSGTNIDSQYSHLEKLMTAPKENKSIVRLKKMYMVYKESYASTLTLLIANRSGYQVGRRSIE